MNEELRQYIAITPCRNEENNLPNLMQSMLAQTIKPALWLILNDGSTDETGKIIFEAERNFDWIKGVSLGEHREYMGTHIAYVCNKGFEIATEYCNENNLFYEYVALVDADNILEYRYFEKLIVEFEKDSKLGLASGNNAHADIGNILDELRAKNPNMTVMHRDFWSMWGRDQMVVQYGRSDLPMGSARMWGKKCFEATGGYLAVPLPDSVSNSMAKIKGWKTRRFKEIKVIEREGLVKQGLWGGYKERGESYFFLGYPLYLTTLKALKYTFKKPYYVGVAYFYGYIRYLILRKKRVNDEEVMYYYKHTRTTELKTFYANKLKKLIGK